MNLKQKYEEQFGKEQAEAAENAAFRHMNELSEPPRLDSQDPFKWVLIQLISFGCVEHGCKGITVTEEEFRQFCLEHADLAKYDGNISWLTLFCGAYEPYIAREETEG